MTKAFRFLFILILTLNWAANSFAKEQFVLALIDKKPWAYYLDSELTGIYPELFRGLAAVFAAKHQTQLKLVAMPLSRILYEFEANSSLNATIMSYHKKRLNHIAPKLPIYKTPFVILSLKDSGINTIHDIKNRRVSMLIGGTGCPCLGDKVPYTRVRVRDHSLGIRMLMRNRVDAVVGPSIRLFGHIDNLDLPFRLEKPIPYEWRTVWLWSGITSNDVKEWESINKYVRQESTQQTFSRLVTTYLSANQAAHLYPINEDVASNLNAKDK